MIRKSLIPVIILLWASPYRVTEASDDDATGMARIVSWAQRADDAGSEPLPSPFENGIYPWPAPQFPWVGIDAVARTGWWGVQSSGAKTKVGEFQDVSSSPFWDVDAVFNDGQRSLDFFGTAQDNEANTARVNFFDPNITARVEYDRFIRRLDHLPLQGTSINDPIGPADNVITDDLNVGDDYAIRVQELKTTLKGQLGKDVKWRLNLWGLRKTGDRQANAVGHCFDLDPAAGSQQNKCHVVSQRQQIDWLTMEMEPVIEGQFGDFNVEYARTMRTFTQSDQTVNRTYTRFGFSPASGTGGPPFPYAVVPDSYTQIDRLKINGKLSDNNQMYAYLFNGDTNDNFRDTHRSFNGFDVRLTNQSLEGVTVTGYAKTTNEHNQLPPYLLPEETSGTVRHPIDYSRTLAGVNGRWKPFHGQFSYGSAFDPWSTFALSGGYEYYQVARDFATYSSSRLGTFAQQDTQRHEVKLGPSMRFSETIDSFARYRGRFAVNPLVGVTESSGLANTNQPTQEHGVDLGGTWTPATNFMATAQFSLVNSWNHTTNTATGNNNSINFRENSYPIVTTVWFAPTEKLSLTGGYAYFSNWIQQDVSIGFRDSPLDNLQSNYQGQNEVVSFNANYAWSPDTNLVGGLEWNRGNNGFSLSPSTTGADYSQLPLFSNVLVDTIRINTGVDHQLGAGVSSYLRYNYFDFEDQSQAYNSGTAHFFLAGLSAVY